jgi:uncharacterized protein YegL
MRRLPVYLLLDTSGSMSGEPIEAVKNGMQVLITTLRQDPFALETAFLSVITFDSSARQIVPLTDLSAFRMPDIFANGSTALGDALSVLSSRVDVEVMKATYDRKGDWKPIVFIMTDGKPTDDWERGLKQFRQRTFGITVACGAGHDADLKVLKKITDHVVQLDTTDSSVIKSFFRWVSASISSGSQKVEQSGKEVKGWDELPPPPPDINMMI